MKLAVRACSGVALAALVSTTSFGVLADEFADIDPKVLAKGIELLAAAWTIPIAVADTSEKEIAFLDRNAEKPVAFPMLKPAPELPLGDYGAVTIYGVFDRDPWINLYDLDIRSRREGAFGGLFRRRFH